MDSGKTRIAILAFSTLIMGAQIITGIIADVAGHFPDAGQTKIKLLLTLPFLVATLFSLLAGPLANVISKKTLIIISHIVLLAGCFLAYALGGISIQALLTTSVLLGVSQGMLSTLSMALIADYYEGGERGALMGLQATFATFGGLLLVFLGAALAGIYWRDTYLILLVALPSLLIVLKFLPRDTPVKGSETLDESGAAITGAAWFYILTDFVYGIFVFILQANLAFYISQNGFGGADTAGYANSTLVAAGGVTGIFYGRLSKAFKRFVLPMGLMVSVAGYLLLYIVGNLASVFMASLCIGYGLTSTVATVMFNASVVVPPSASTMAIALVNTAGNIGIFVSPFVSGLIMNALGAEDIRTQFLIGAVGMGALALIYMIGDSAVTRRSVKTAAQVA